MTDVLKTKGLCKSLGGKPVLVDASLCVEQGEIVALLGPSGSGKTTFLNLVAGLDRQDAGEVVINGKVVSGPECWVPPHQRGVGMIFQHQMLWPHITVNGHLELVLKVQGVDEADSEEKIKRQLKSVGLADRGEARPSELSGGERQRLSIARALVGDSRLILMDEPTTFLDTKLKAEILDLIQALHAERNFGAVLVTHDEAEADCLANSIQVVEQGKLIDKAT